MIKMIAIIALSILFCSQKINAQCNIKTNNRADGVTIKYFEPVLMGKGTGCELGRLYHNKWNRVFL